MIWIKKWRRGVFGNVLGVRLRFGPFAFDRQNRLLWRDGTEVALPPRVLGVLELLIDRAGEVVARQDLLDGVWKDAFVTDTSLAEAVSFLRQALGDDPQSPRYIQTVHRRGYRFLAPVTPDRGLTADGGTGGLTPDGRTGSLTPDLHVAQATDLRAVSATPDEVKPSIAWQLVPWSVAILCAVLAAVTIWRLVTRPEPEPAPIARFELRPADGTSFDRRASSVAVSADGGTLAWAACADDSGDCALYVRRVDRLDAARLPGTEGAAAPCFSPDGRWIAFFADGKLKKIAASGGSAAILADAPSPGGATWSADERIAFSGSPAGGIAVVGDQGGTVTPLTAPRVERGEVRHVLPAWLPSGGLLFTIATSPLIDAPGDLAVIPPRSRDWKILRAGVTRGAPAGPGHLLLSAGSDLQAATFDERTLTLTGGADSILASITGGDGIAHFAAGGGTLVAVTAAPPATAAWSDGADGGSLARLASIAIAPDGRRAAGVIADGNASDIWVADLPSGALTRITYGGANVSPAWSHDGSRVFFATRTTGAYGLASRRVDDRGAAQAIASGSSHVFPSSVADDGRIAVTTIAPDGHTAAAIVPAGGGAPQLLHAGPFNEARPVFSPDGRWIAIESDESGRTEIVARPLDDGGRRVAISADGGLRPHWSADGRFVYFESRRHVQRAAVDLAAGVVRAVDTLFDRPAAEILAVTPAGRVLAASRNRRADRALVVLQWLRELRQRLPPPVTAPR